MTGTDWLALIAFSVALGALIVLLSRKDWPSSWLPMSWLDVDEPTPVDPPPYVPPSLATPAAKGLHPDSRRAPDHQATVLRFIAAHHKRNGRVH